MPGLLTLAHVALVLASCASLPPDKGLEPVTIEQASRSDLTVDYDVMVAEMALANGDLAGARVAFLRAIEKDPESAYLELRVSRLIAQLDDLQGAIEHASRAHEMDPDNEEARILLGGYYRFARDVSGAQSVLQGPNGEIISDTTALLLYQIYLENDHIDDARLVAEDLVVNRPEVLGGYMALATVYERMGRPNSAESTLRMAVAEYPDRFVLYSRLARLKRSTGDVRGEVAVYREILERHPHHRGSLLSLGDALITAKDLEAAVEVYAEIVEHYPEDLRSLRRFASLEFAAGRHAQAALLLEDGLARNPEQFELAFSLGQVRRSMGDDAGAMEAFDTIPEGHPSYNEARGQVVAILERQERYDEAIAELNLLRASNPSRTFDFQAAGLYQRAGDFAGGRRIIDAMLLQDPNDEEALYQLGVLYGLDQQYDLAVATMERVLEVNPDNAHALNYVGYSWAERGINLDKAEEYILRALSQRPNDGFIADSLGWVYYMRGKSLLRQSRSEHEIEVLERARKQLVMAAELTGGDPVVSEHLGDVYFSLDQKDRAIEYYREAVEMEHRPKEQPMLLEKLERLRRELEEP